VSNFSSKWTVPDKLQKNMYLTLEVAREGGREGEGGRERERERLD
jgi:hypothetical protein